MSFNIVDSADNTTNSVGVANDNPALSAMGMMIAGIAGIAGVGMVASLAPSTIIGTSLVAGSITYAGHRK
jgi:hypothetical protein